jgi:tetratricopeptide (TPR) repeat protein
LLYQSAVKTNFSSLSVSKPTAIRTGEVKYSGVRLIVSVPNIQRRKRKIVLQSYQKEISFGLTTALLLCLSFNSIASAITTSDPFLKKVDEQLQSAKPPSESLVSELGTFVQKNPTNYQGHFLLGTCYDRLGLLDQSINEFKLATQFSHNDSEPILELIREQMALKQDLTVVKLLKVAEAQFPYDPNVAYWEGNFQLFTKKDPKQAQLFYDRALKSTAKPISGLHLGMAEVALSESHNAKAIEEATKELELHPYTPMAILVAGMAFAKSGLMGVAYAPLHATYADNKARPDVARLYAQSAYWHGDYAGAIEPAIVQMALSSDHDPNHDDLPIKRLLTRSLRRVPRKFGQDMVQSTSQNLDNNPKAFEDPAFHRTLGDVVSELGWHQMAVFQYNLCLLRNPSDAHAWFKLGKECDLYNQDYPYALVCYEKAKALQRGLPTIDNYLERLQDRMAMRDNDLAWRIKDWLRLSYYKMRVAFGSTGP